MRVRLTHSFIIILVSVTLLSEVFRLLIAPSGQVDPEARGLKEYISNTQDLECLNPAMTDMIHMMKKTNYSRSKQSRVFLYTESIANRNMGGDKCPAW